MLPQWELGPFNSHSNMRLTALPYLAYSVAERRGLLLLQIGGWSVIAKNKFYLETNMPHHLPMVTNRTYSFVPLVKTTLNS